MEQINLIIDSLNDAIRDTARAIGFKRIAKEIWPVKNEEAAARHLNDCLNPDRPQELSNAEMMLIARRGREIGCHILISYLNADAGYAPPIPVDPEDQKAELMRQYIEATKDSRRIAEKMERLGR
jgi:hypothetical protein